MAGKQALGDTPNGSVNTPHGNMNFKATQRAGVRRFAWLAALMTLFFSFPANAEVIDNILVSRFRETVVIEIRFSERVQYLRHFPPDTGKEVNVYISFVPRNGVVPPPVRETRKSPPNDFIPPFTVTYPGQGSSVKVTFSEPVSFKIGPGSDVNSIRIRVTPPEKKEKEVKAVPEPQPAKEADVKAAPSLPPAKEVARVPSGIVVGAPVELAPVPRTKVSDADMAKASEVDVAAAQLLADARAALEAQEYAKAIDILNRVLNLPPNRFSREAQELAGVARERNKEFPKAKAEYELYLKLYPDGEDAARVRRRLAGLDTGEKEALRKVEVVEARPTEKMLYGAVSQFYYNGATKIDTTTKTPSLPGSEQLSFTDQSALITSLDVTGRIRRDNSDTRLVLRDTYYANFLEGDENSNRLYAAYAQHDQKDWGLLVRAGRQSPPTGGVVERFDGAYVRKTLGRWARLLGLAGSPKDFDIDSSRRFYQGGLELGRDGGAFSGTLYAFEQTIDDIPDRQTVGGEVRYFSNGSSLYTLVDYDTLFEELNILLTQGNWQPAQSTNINVILDRRKTPTLQTANALIGEPVTSIQALLDSGLTAEMLRERALGVTADATLWLVGVTQTLNGKWQIGGDVRANSISATEGGGMVPPTPATGTIYTYTLQATANSIFGGADINVLSVGLIEAPTYRGSLALLSNSSTWNRWHVEPSLRYYQQDDDSGTALTRTNAALRLSYRVRDSISLEAEAGYERSVTDTDFAEDVVRREYFSLGYRWDFQ